MSSQDFFQIIPDSICVDDIASQHHIFEAALLARASDWPQNSHQACSSYPIFTPPNRIRELQNIHSALQAALPAIVRRWWSRSDFQSAIPLSAKMEQVFRRLDIERPYNRQGSIRPDFLVPENAEEPLRVCEINARFVFNGFIIGAWLGDSVKEMGFLPEGYEVSAATIEGVRNAYSKLVNPEKPIGLVTHRERVLGKAMDSNFFHQLHPQTRIVNPASLRLVTSPSSLPNVQLSDDIGVLEQFILELHQEEIEELDEDVLLQLGRTCWNDLRTIYFTHDKRFLAILQREVGWLFKLGDITTFQAETLRHAIAETYISGDPVFQFLIPSTDPIEKNNWTLKKCRAGKGEGMIFGKDLSEKEWKNVLNVFGVDSNKTKSDRLSTLNTSNDTTDTSTDILSSAMNLEFIWREPYVLQRYVKQKKQDLVIRKPTLPTITMMNVRWCTVGTMLCLGDCFLGVSPWRASDGDIIALGRGGVLLPGVTTSGAWVSETNTSSGTPCPVPAAVSSLDLSGPYYLSVPPDARISAPDLASFAGQVEPTQAALAKYGLAVVHLEFDDPKSTYMISLIRALGKPHTHSNSHGILWDVKPVEGLDSDIAARSKTMEYFPWHTDCSFERSPPRYFGLHIIHSDRFGGGKLRLVRSESLLSRLTDTFLATLQLPLYRIAVPKEFHKGVDHIVGPIISSDGQRKLRYRMEIIQPLTEEAEKALAALDGILGTLGEDEKVLGDDCMRDRTVVLVDNARWLHARSRVNDPDRLLRRARWEAQAFA